MLHVFEENWFLLEFVVSTIFFALLFYLISYVRMSRKLPPGPIGLPIVGYLPFLTKIPHLKMIELSTKYGDIISMRLGSTLVVVLNKGRVIREAFTKPEFLGKPPNTPLNLFKNFESFAISSGRKWQEQRRFAIQVMKDLGFGKSLMEENMRKEIQGFLQDMAKSDGMPINIAENLTPSISNNISYFVFGRRYTKNDPRRVFVDGAVEILTRAVMQVSSYIFFPWMMKLPFSSKILKVEEASKAAHDLRIFVGKLIEEHEMTLDPNNIRDYVDGYLMEMNNRLRKDPHTVFSHNMLAGSVINFFGAGTETIRTTLDWCLYTMAAFKDIQKKVQSEIDEMIGKERKPLWNDQRHMPFTQAVLAEVQRWKTVAAVGLLRYTLKDTELQGYHIPKGTLVMPNFWFAHHDPEDWERPDDFMPERFLSKDGKSIVRHENYMPFSVGRRSCPGEFIARMEVFLYFTSILQRFSVELPKGTSANFEGKMGITYHPKPHQICFKPRT